MERPDVHVSLADRELKPTVEILRADGGRVTGWGWQCSCGDGDLPRVKSKRATVLEKAREHFDTKHGGQH